MRLLSSHILPRSESNLTHGHLDFKKIFPGRNPRTLAYRGEERKGGEGKGLKGSYTSKGSAEGKDRGDRDGRGKGGEGPAAGGSCSKVLRGDRRPCFSVLLSQSSTALTWFTDNSINSVKDMQCFNQLRVYFVSL